MSGAKMETPGAQSRIRSLFGAGRPWRGGGRTAHAWESSGFHLLWADGDTGETALGGLWNAYRGRRHYNVVLLAAGADEGRLRVAGPSGALPLRDLPVAAVLRLLGDARGLDPNAAARLLAREFARAADAAAPGVHVRDLLTPHFVASRLLPLHGDGLAAASADAAAHVGAGWRDLFGRLGYAIGDGPAPHSYLLRHGGAPVAVVRPYDDPAAFGRLDERGAPPAGALLAACRRTGAGWGVLAAAGRYRLFGASPGAAGATARYLELDAAGLEDRRYLGLLAPAALREGGWFGEWIAEARGFGERLSGDLRRRIADAALPALASGLGEHLEAAGADPGDRGELRRIEAAALTLVFRVMFLLHTEARGYLPVHSEAYRRESAGELAREARDGLGSHDPRSTRLWDRLRTLVRMIRNGDRAAGVPAYNGSLFAAAGFPGGDLLEGAAVSDRWLAPALAAVAFESDDPDRPGLDYAGLDVSHLGAIYEALLGLRLARAPEDLAWDAARDLYRPPRAGEETAVARGGLYWRSEAGGRKAAGVFYTRREFVRHLLRHSLEPALEEHLERVREEAERDPEAAARRLFDFTVIDPAMGSGHFLTEALDMTADRMAAFLAETPGGLPAVRGLLGELREASGGDGAAEDGDLLRRLVLKRCIHGVDLSPMAVEVANVTLWLASFVPGLALSWLGGNLKAGDALIGVADPSVVGAADSPLFTGTHVRAAMRRAAALQRELAAVPDRTPGEVRRSERLAAGLREATAGLRDAFDLWAAGPLGLGGARAALELHADAIVAGEAGGETAEKIAAARGVAGSFRFFHWPLEFPQVFDRERPGFDVVAGNPPWNKVKFEMPAFLALHDPGIRGVRTALERDERAGALFRRQPGLREEAERAERQAAEQRGFFRPEQGYVLQGSGDTDLYKLFCERYGAITRADGFLGVVLPRAAFLNDGSRGFRRRLFGEWSPGRIDVLLNNRGWAFDIHRQYTIALVAAQHRVAAGGAFAVTGPSANARDFAAASRTEGVPVAIDDLAAWTSARDGQPGWELPLLPSRRSAGVLGQLRRGIRFDVMEWPEYLSAFGADENLP